jgi:hypothetical protein
MARGGRGGGGGGGDRGGGGGGGYGGGGGGGGGGFGGGGRDGGGGGGRGGGRGRGRIPPGQRPVSEEQRIDIAVQLRDFQASPSPVVCARLHLRFASERVCVCAFLCV